MSRLAARRGCSPVPRGGDTATVISSLIATVKLNDVDPQAWLADVLARIADIRSVVSTSCFPGTGGKPSTGHSAAA